jgi:hypothetical protein
MMVISAACVFTLFTALGANAGVTPRRNSSTHLNDLAVADGKQYFGVAVDTNEVANATYAVNLRSRPLFGMPSIAI